MSKEKPIKQSNYIGIKSPNFDADKHAVMVDRDLSRLFLYVRQMPQGVENSFIGVTSTGMVGAGTATILSMSGSASRNAGYLTLIFASGATAFVPFFASTST